MPSGNNALPPFPILRGGTIIATRKELLEEFVKFLAGHNVVLAGPVPDTVLGVMILKPLHEESYPAMYDAFLEHFNTLRGE